MKYRIVEYPGIGHKAQVLVRGWWLDLHEPHHDPALCKEIIKNHKASALPMQVVHEEEG